MKKVFKNSLVLLIVLTSFLSFGHDVPKKEKKDNLKETYISFTDVKKGSTLSLKNDNHELIYVEKIETTGEYVKKFDLSLLPSGNYYFELEKDIEIKTKPFTVTFEKVTFHEEKSNGFHKPMVRYKDDKIFISQLALEKNPLEIKLYYDGDAQGNELIYDEKLSDGLILERVLQLSKKHPGNYQLVLNTQDHTFTQKFSL